MQLTTLGYDGAEAATKIQLTVGKCPGVSDPGRLVGTTPQEWTLTDWVNSPQLSLAKLRGRVVVVRFWTMSCEFCEASMPALEKMAKELAGRPVTFVGAFHAKPATAVGDMTEPSKIAKQWGISFPLAFDRDWRTLRTWYLDGQHRHATSVTFVIGKDGRIVHVHPGPVFFPADAAKDPRANRDYDALHAAIQKALAAHELKRR